VNWSNMKVKTKLAVLIAMMCSVLAVVAGLGFYGISDTAGGIGETNESLKQVVVADNLVKDFLTIRLDLVYMMLLTDTGRVEENGLTWSSRSPLSVKGSKRSKQYLCKTRIRNF
jgi:methyl-accepting chemotaxis protein